MYHIIHIISLLIAFIIWKSIGGLGGLIVACIFFGFIELIVSGVLKFLVSPFRQEPELTPAERGVDTKECKKCGGVIASDDIVCKHCGRTAYGRILIVSLMGIVPIALAILWAKRPLWRWALGIPGVLFFLCSLYMILEAVQVRGRRRRGTLEPQTTRSVSEQSSGEATSESAQRTAVCSTPRPNLLFSDQQIDKSNNSVSPPAKSQSVLAWGIIFSLGVFFIVIIGGSLTWLHLLSKGDLRYGRDCFVVVTGVDRNDPSKVQMQGIVAIREGKLSSGMPGAVFVVGLPQGVTMGGKYFTYRQIILLNSNHEYVLAPPGLRLTVPDHVTILGVRLKAGQRIKVPQDSKFSVTSRLPLRVLEG